MAKKKLFKKIAFKAVVCFVNVSTVLAMTVGPVFAAAPAVVTVSVEQESINIVFDQGVLTSPDPGGINEAGAATSYADDLRNYTLQSPEGTEIPLSRISPIELSTDYTPSDGGNSTMSILGLDLPQGQSYRLTVNNIGNLATTTEVMATESETIGTVQATTTPRLDNITPLYGQYAELGTQITLSGANLPTATSTAAISCWNGLESVSIPVVSANGGTEVVGLIPNNELLSGGAKNCTVTNSDTGLSSLSRKFYLYDDSYFGVLYGTVKDADGSTPVDKVSVSAYVSGNNWLRYWGETQKNGAFAIVVPAGTYTVETTTPGAGSTGAAPIKVTNKTVTAGSATSVGNITFQTTLISGKIYAPDGITPVYGAEVRAHNMSWSIEQVATTGLDGSYKLYVTPSSSAPLYVIEVNPGNYYKNILGYLETNMEISVASATPQTHNINLATINVTGTVKTPTGDVTASNPYPDQLVPRANVHIMGTSFDRWSQTDDNGAFKFGGVPDGTYTLEIEPPFCGDSDPDVAKLCVYARTRIDNKTVSDGTGAFGVNRFSAPNFFGYVYGDADNDDQVDNGEAIANVWVQLDRDGFFTGSPTDSNGRYAFYLPNTGSYHLNVYPPSDSGYANSMSDITVSTLPLTSAYNVKLSLPNVSGFVYGPDGTVGQGGGWINLCPINTPGNCYGSGPDSNGAFNVSVPDGTWQMQLNPNWGSEYATPAPKTVVISGGSVSTVDDDSNDDDEPFNSSNKIIVRMVDPTNDPTGFTGYVYGPVGTDNETAGQSNVGIGMRPAIAEGTSCRGEGMSIWTQTNNTGKFAVSGISEGLYEIEAMPWSDGSYSRVRICHTVTSESDTRTKNINLTQPNITGTIATPSGSISNENPTPDTALGNTWVSLFVEGPMGPGGGSYGGNANESGIFSLGGVPGGTYTLEVNSNWGSVYSNRRYNGVTLSDSNNDGIADTTNLNEVIGTVSTNFPNGAIRIGTPNLKGRVVDPDGNPVQNVWVSVHDDMWMSNNGSNADGDGYFRVGGLSDGNYTIEINMPWGGEQALVAPSGLSVVISDNVGVIKQNGTALTNNTVILTVPEKTITGTVTKSGAAVSNAIVSANRDRGGGHYETRTNSSGQYTLKVSGGSWWLDVWPSYDGTQPDWVYNEQPRQVTFAENSTSENETVDFTVAVANATITGVVKTPTNSAVQGVWVDARGNKGMGSGSQTDSNGRFSIKVPAGTYFVDVFSNSPDYGSPDPKSVTVASEQISDAGTLYLKAKNSHIKGFVQDDAGNPLQNIVVNAHMMNSPGWVSSYTDQTGAYDLSLWSGQWNVMVMPMSQNYVYQGAPKNIIVTASETSEENNFQLKNANKTIKVKVKKSGSGDVVTDIWGGVWIKDTEAGMIDFGGPMEDMMEKSGMMGGDMGGDTATMSGAGTSGMEKGGFMGGALYNGYTELKVPSGTFELGLGMPPGSKYTLVSTQTVTISDSDTSKEVTLYVKQNNATISGVFYLDTNSNNRYDSGTDTIVTGIRAFVHADRDGGGWQMIESRTDGTYSLLVSEGAWFTNAFIDPSMSFSSSRYMVVNDATKTTVADSGIATRNFKVKKLNATITGTVYNADGTTPMSSSYGSVWVFADFGSSDMVNEFNGPGGPGLGTYTDSSGNYSLQVPAGTYKVGAGIPPWDTRDLLNPELITVIVAADAASSGNDLQFKESNATITGEITLDGERKAGYVKAWSDAGSGSGAVSTDGTYTLKVMQGDTWHLTASAEISNAYYESDEIEIEITQGTATTTQDLALESKNLVVPEGVSSTFDASQSKTLKLTKTIDGTVQDEVVMEIPAGAIASTGSITVSITPTVNTKPDAKDKPIGIAYNFEAMDSSGNSIESFVQDVTIYIYYDEEFIVAAGYSEDSITPKYYDTSTGSWENYSNVVRDTDNDVMIIKTNHFSTGGFTGNGNIPTAPSSLSGISGGTSSANLSWTDNSDSETGFKIYRNGTLITTTAANATTYNDTGLSSGTTYTYYVKSTNTAGDSTASNTVSVTTDGGGGGGVGASAGDESSVSVTKKETQTEETEEDATKEKPIAEMTQTELKAKILEIQALILGLQKQLFELTGGSAYEGLPESFKFKTKLKYGMSSEEVKYLQIFLKAQGTDIYPEGLVTGYFGSMTQAAVIKFQEKYSSEVLAPFGITSGTGLVGEKTMEKINLMLAR